MAFFLSGGRGRIGLIIYSVISRPHGPIATWYIGRTSVGYLKLIPITIPPIKAGKNTNSVHGITHKTDVF